MTGQLEFKFVLSELKYPIIGPVPPPYHDLYDMVCFSEDGCLFDLFWLGGLSGYPPIINQKVNIDKHGNACLRGHVEQSPYFSIGVVVGMRYTYTFDGYKTIVRIRVEKEEANSVHREPL